MHNLRIIIGSHFKSYYNFESGQPRRLWPYFLIVFLFSLMATLAFEPSSEILPTIITVESVLIGFSFSVLFFLLSNRITISENETSIRKSIAVERLEKLSIELFFNVSYFNIISVAGLLTALSLMIQPIPFLTWVSGLKIGSAAMSSTYPQIYSLLEDFGNYLNFVKELLFTIFLIEACVTFIRTTGRIGYYFHKRLEIER